MIRQPRCSALALRALLHYSILEEGNVTASVCLSCRRRRRNAEMSDRCVCRRGVAKRFGNEFPEQNLVEEIMI